jgi:hypothetical protein
MFMNPTASRMRSLIIALPFTWLLAPAAASAQEAYTLDAEGRPADRAEAPENQKGDQKSVAIELNPLAATIGRYSVNVEVMVSPHQAVVVNPHVDHVTTEVTAGDAKYTESFVGGGAELGYRYYTGSKGPNGFFVGPSFLLGHYSATTGESDQSVSFTSVGAAIDIGGQAVVGPGIVVGGGFGLQWTEATEDFQDMPLAAAAIAGGGVRPRFLVTVGYALGAALL